MKRFLDYWIMYLYHFVLYVRPGDITPWVSAYFYFTLFMFSLSLDLCFILYFILDYLQTGDVFREFVYSNQEIVWWGLCGIITLITSIYYWKDQHERIEKSYNALTKGKRTLVKVCIYLLEISGPVASFILFRLVWFGQVKWW